MPTIRSIFSPACLWPFALCLATACASHDGQEPELETPRTAATELRATIASVQLAQDCPDPPAPAAQTPAAQEPAQPHEVMPSPGDVERERSAGAMAPGAALPGGGGWAPPCTQSGVQLTLSHDGKEALPFEIKAMRLTAAGQGGVLATVPFRGPTKWTEADRYEPWDQQLAPAAELKASYKLGEPDWAMVARTPDDTFGKRFVLEVDVVFAGRSMTLRSPEFERERPHVIVT
ncbi:MAG: hypothetical protein IAG13_35195 [Deltaproteobacteria bacterium]|nr:hypothetical protein [Nannocystaceae bacterium]